MMEQKRKIRPGFIIAGILVIIFGFSMMYFMGASYKNASEQSGICKTDECFISAANLCENSTFYSNEDLGFVRYETSECFFMKTVVKANDKEIPEVKEMVEGKGLLCQYDFGNFDEKWISSISDDLENCQGPLKDAIGELILFSAP